MITNGSNITLSLVTETFPPEVNGVSMTMGRLVDGLLNAGVVVSVIAPMRSDRKLHDRFPLLQVRGLPIPRYQGLRFGLPAHAKIKRFWQAQRPDIVHIATEGPLGWSALRCAESMRIPVVSSFHTNFHSYGEHYGFSLFKRPVLAWLRHLHNRTACTFAPSDDVIAALSQQGFQRMRLLSRGVDTQLFNPQRRDPDLRGQWNAGPQTPVAIYVGRMAAEKNIDLVIQASVEMREVLPDLRLVFVGDGPDRARIAKHCPGAVFAGVRRGEDLARHYASADCFLFASVTETFGNVVTEAMASALTVVAYDYAAAKRFIIHNNNGFTAAFNDSGAYLRSAEQAARQRQHWCAIGQRARATILPQSWESVVSSYLNDIRCP